MKKTIILFAAALTASIACNKEIVEQPVSEVYTITAVAPDTKALVDGLQVQWTTGDQVALFQSSGEPAVFTLDGEGPVTNGTFSTTASGLDPNGLAAFPASGASNNGGMISVVIPSEFTYGTAPVPMVGTSDGGTTFNFSLACGAIQISLKDVPPYPCNLVITSDKNITGTLVIPNYRDPTNAMFNSTGAGKTITVTGIPRGNVTVTVPMPAGTHNISFKLVAAADGTSIVPRSDKSKSGVEIISSKIARMKQIDLEEGTKAPVVKDSSKEFSIYSLLGTTTWKVCTTDSQGLYVLGGGGSGANYNRFIPVTEKSWCWNYNANNELDNELVITISTYSSPYQGKFNWSAGANGKFWNYKWNFTTSTSAQAAFNGTDLSAYYDRIPKGESSFSLDTSTWDVTFSNGDKAHLLAAGVYLCYGNQLTVPANCFALMFHIGNLKPYNSTWHDQDIDRFIFSPLEYIIVFKKK